MRIDAGDEGIEARVQGVIWGWLKKGHYPKGVFEWMGVGVSVMIWILAYRDLSEDRLA